MWQLLGFSQIKFSLIVCLITYLINQYSVYSRIEAKLLVYLPGPENLLGAFTEEDKLPSSKHDVNKVKGSENFPNVPYMYMMYIFKAVTPTVDTHLRLKTRASRRLLCQVEKAL